MHNNKLIEKIAHNKPHMTKIAYYRKNGTMYQLHISDDIINAFKGNDKITIGEFVNNAHNSIVARNF